MKGIKNKTSSLQIQIFNGSLLQTATIQTDWKLKLKKSLFKWHKGKELGGGGGERGRNINLISGRRFMARS